MPSGYTEKLHNGEQSFTDYAQGCARAFGAFMECRDTPMSEPLPAGMWKVSDHAVNAVKVARANLTQIEEMSVDDAAARAATDYEENVKTHRERWKKNAAIRHRYEDMLAQARSWEPPTPEHVAFKTFMTEQLQESIRFDTGYEPEMPKRLSATEWLNRELEGRKQDLEWAEKHLREETERRAGAKAWAEALLSSLDSVAAPALSTTEDGQP